VVVVVVVVGRALMHALQHGVDRSPFRPGSPESARNA